MGEYHSITKKVLTASKELSLYSRYILLMFTFTFAIPNKILINNGINKIYLFFGTIIIFTLGFYANPYVYCIYIMYILLALESWLFAVSYKNVFGFNKIVKKLFFNESEEEDSFSKEYFDFFWGNMQRAGGDAAKAGAAAIATAIAAMRQRNAELTHVRETAQDNTQQKITADKNLGCPKSSESYEAYYAQQESKAINETLVLKAERKMSEAYS